MGYFVAGAITMLIGLSMGIILGAVIIAYGNSVTEK